MIKRLKKIDREVIELLFDKELLEGSTNEINGYDLLFIDKTKGYISEMTLMSEKCKRGIKK